MDKDYIKNHLTVRVNDATGVLVSPCDKELLYVFTCKHVINKKDDLKVRYDSQEGQEERFFEVCNVVTVEDEKSDMAIIIVKKNGLNVAHLYPSSDRRNCYHIGFPSCRVEEQDKFQNCRVSYISHFDSGDESRLIEYEYEKALTHNEIVGMSGGGIFNDKGCLVGIHTQLPVKPEKEMHGKGVMIPISHYFELISSKNLSPVYKYDLCKFGEMIHWVFDFKEQIFVCQKSKQFLSDIVPYKKVVSNLSPKKVIDILKNRGKISPNTQIESLHDGYWKAFTLFLVGILSFLDCEDSIDEDIIIKLYEKFHYCYSEEEIDTYKVRETLNEKHLLGKEQGAYLIVGGLKQTVFNGCFLRPTTVVPDISKAHMIDNYDISYGKEYWLNPVTIVNNIIFEKAVEKCADKEDLDSVSINEYREQLKKVFNLSDNAS